MDRWSSAALSLMEALQNAATQLSALRNTQMRTAGLDRERWAALQAIGRSNRYLSISDLARILKQSRQGAHRMALALNRAGYLELLPNPDDRRILQLMLTPSGKSLLADMQHRFKMSVIEFAYHLDDRQMRAATQLLNELKASMASYRAARSASWLSEAPRVRANTKSDRSSWHRRRS